MKRFPILLGLMLPTAAMADPAAVALADIPPPVLFAVRGAAPGVTITGAEYKEREGRHYYDVAGRTKDGAEIELDVLQRGEAWAVVEIQRDIAWAAAPAPVRKAAASVLAGTAPVRVIESRQMDGKIIYELFAPGRSAEPAHEVMLDGEAARVLTEKWPH